MRTHSPWRNEPFLVAMLAAAAGFLRLLILWLKPDGHLVMHIPDDAFYYLVPARNFAHMGRWTFDGVEPATGFHLLWGYFLVVLYRLMPGLSFHAVFALAGSVQVLCLSLAALLLSRTAVRLFGRGAGIGVAVVFLSATVLVQAGWLMESAFVILLAAALLDLLARTGLPGRGGVLPAALTLGWLLELSRSDAGLLPAALLLMLLVLWRRGSVSRTMPIAAASVLAGACLGVATILLHTHVVSGHWVQASAQQKLFWSSVGGRSSLRSVAGTPLSVLQPLHYAVPHYSRNAAAVRLASAAGHVAGFAVLAMVVAGAALLARRTSPLARALLVTLALLVAAYCVFYQHDGALFDWYISNFAVGMAVISAAAAAWFLPRAPRCTLALAAALTCAGWVCSLVPNGPWQECMYRAGLYLHEHDLPAAQGAFNSGIVGFFAERQVTNLDGLVNDSILPYAMHGQLGEYMAHRNIAYVFDSPFMLDDAVMQQRGGYPGGLRACLREETDTFPDDPNNTWEGGHIHLYRFDLECLRAGRERAAAVR